MIARLRIAILLVAAVVCTRPYAAGAEDTVTTPYEGIRHIKRITATPNRIHIVEVDLTNPKIRLRATRSEHRRRVASSFADLYDCQIATNGDFFSYTDYSTTGVAMGHGEKWSDTGDNSTQGYIGFGRANEVGISLPSTVEGPKDWMEDVVGGRPMLVKDGTAVTFSPCTDAFCARNPRTAIGFNQAHTRMWLVVVDGRSSSSAGASLNELAQLMKGLGAHRALNLDGGGSSTMYIKGEGGVQNSPSDGSQRVVANHVGVCIVKPVGSLRGYIRKHDIMDETAGMAGVTVMLSSGQSAVTDGDGLYQIAEVPRGDVTITAAADGFAGEREVYVTADDLTWGSIAMSEEVAEEEDPGEPGSDAGTGDDDIADDPGDMDGGCSTSGGSTGGVALLLLALALRTGSAPWWRASSSRPRPPPPHRRRRRRRDRSPGAGRAHLEP